MEKKGVIYTKQTIAQILGLSERRIGQLTKEGVLEEFSTGHYKLLPAIRGYIRYQNEQIETKSKKTELDVEKERLTRIKSENAELDLGLKRNDHHLAADVEFVVTNMLIAFKAKIETLPYKVLPAMMNVPEGADKAEHMTDTLKQAVAEALKELNAYNPADYAAKKYQRNTESKGGGDE
ncbi:MAG: hypothetical protein FWF81_01355 [Defluviitaleaceae bacterium]|nr:hypothetical protein [Defluviitaleaceae bacterium]